MISHSGWNVIIRNILKFDGNYTINGNRDNNV